MDAAQDVRRDRAPITPAALGTLGIIASQGYSALSFGAEGWRVALYVASLAGFSGAVLAALAALLARDAAARSPRSMRRDSSSHRPHCSPSVSC